MGNSNTDFKYQCAPQSPWQSKPVLPGEGRQGHGEEWELKHPHSLQYFPEPPQHLLLLHLKLSSQVPLTQVIFPFPYLLILPFPHLHRVKFAFIRSKVSTCQTKSLEIHFSNEQFPSSELPHLSLCHSRAVQGRVLQAFHTECKTPLF